MAEKESYQVLKQKLDSILSQLQHDDVDIDEAVKLHKEGQKIVAKLDEYLQHIADDAGLEIKRIDS